MKLLVQVISCLIDFTAQIDTIRGGVDVPVLSEAKLHQSYKLHGP